MEEQIFLRYKGRGNFMLDVPARDLTRAEVEATGLQLERILESGLYEQVVAEQTPAADPAPETPAVVVDQQPLPEDHQQGEVPAQEPNQEVAG